MPRDIQNIGSVDALPGSPIKSSRAARARKMETASGFEKRSRSSGTGVAFMATIMAVSVCPTKALDPTPRKQVVLNPLPGLFGLPQAPSEESFTKAAQVSVPKPYTASFKPILGECRS